MSEAILVNQMTPYELENLIERIVERVILKYVQKQPEEPKTYRERRAGKIDKDALQDKKVLSFDEGIIYTGFARSYMYKLTSAGIIPYSQPNGKMIYFDREKLDEWLLSRGNSNQEEKQKQAATYVTTTK